MIRRTTVAWRRRGDPHAQIHLPPLTAEEALLVANLLDRAIAALWRTHGDAMAELLACIDPDASLQTETPDAQPAVTPRTGPADEDF
jgi:hypothetical protein